VIVGALLILAGAAGAAWAMRVATLRRRPLDLVGALLAPLFIALAVMGGVRLLLPRFFS
jgi:hypothetical protein